MCVCVCIMCNPFAGVNTTRSTIDLNVLHIFSKFSSISEASASELLEKLESMFLCTCSSYGNVKKLFLNKKFECIVRLYRNII